MKTPEGYEKAEIDAYLKKIGAYAIKPATYGFGASGTADRVGCYRGFFFAIEVKRPSKSPTPLQYRRLREVQKAGGRAFHGTAEKVIPEFEAWCRELLG